MELGLSLQGLLDHMEFDSTEGHEQPLKGFKELCWDETLGSGSRADWSKGEDPELI